MTPATASLPTRRLLGRASAATLALLATLGCTLPTSIAAAEGPPIKSGVLTVLDQGGRAVELLHMLTFAQLAAVLNTTPAELAAQIESQPGSGELNVLLKGWIADPNVTLQSVLEGLNAQGLNPGAAEALINSLLSRVAGGSVQLQGVVSTLLTDLGLDGKLGAVASQLGISTDALKEAAVTPATVEQVASSLNTGPSTVSSTLSGAGALITPLTPTTPIVLAPVVETGGGTTEIVGVPTGSGGVSLTVINSTASGLAGPNPAAAISNAFSIVSIKLTKNGLILETVSLPATGRLAISATANARSTSVRHGHSRTTRKTVAVAPLATNVAAGTRTFTLHPRRAIGSAKQVVLSVTTTYTPSGGSANSKRSSATFRKKGGRGH